MKTGDKLYCYNNINLNKISNGTLDFTVGNYYTIIYYSKSNIGILNDNVNNNIDDFTLYVDKNNLSYRNWFITISELRKQKLDKLNAQIL